jgi:hypothetical protein
MYQNGDQVTPTRQREHLGHPLPPDTRFFFSRLMATRGRYALTLLVEFPHGSLLCSGFDRGGLPSLDPWHVAAQRVTQINGGLVDRDIFHGGVQLELVAVGFAFVTVVAIRAEIHRERATMRGRGAVYGTRSTELVTVAVSRLESDFVENLLHRDLSAEHVEVNAGHDHLLRGTLVSSLR